jgi:hypothetical protein
MFKYFKRRRAMREYQEALRYHQMQLGFDLRKLLAQCVELGYIAGCARSATIIRMLDDGEYNWDTYIIDDYKQLLGLK